MRKYDESRKARFGEKTGHGPIAMQKMRKNKGVSSSGCYKCVQKGHMRRDTANPNRTVNNLVLEAVSPTKHVHFEQKSKFASNMSNLDSSRNIASREGQGYSVTVLHLP